MGFNYSNLLENTGNSKSLNRPTLFRPSITHLEKLSETDTSLTKKIRSMRSEPYKEKIWDNLNVDRFMFDCIPAVLKTVDPDARPLNYPKT